MNAEELIERFKKSLNAPSTKDEKFKVVLICIGISTTFWFFNALNQDNYTTQIAYPVEWSYDQEQYQQVGALPSRIPLEVTGGGWDLMTRSFGFNMDAISIALNAPDESKYMLTSRLRSDLSRNLDPVTINYVIQDSLKYDIQKIVSRQIGLTLDYSGISIDSDYRLSSEFRLNPDSITVEGPMNIINSMPSSLPVIADVSDLDEDFSSDISLPTLPDLVSANVNETNLSFEVMRYITITERHHIELINAPNDGWIAFPPELIVDYALGESEFDATDSTRIKLVVDFNQLEKSDSTVLVEIIKGRALIEEVRLSADTVKLVRQ